MMDSLCSMNSLMTFIKGQTIEFNKKSIKIREFLGAGTFGTVYKCLDLSNNEAIALKVFNVRGDEDMEIAESEILLHQKIPFHRNILEIYDCTKSPNFLAIICEFCNLGDLPRYYEGKGKIFTIKHQQEIMLQLAEGMAHLHKNDFIHRDIKPGNLLATTGSNGETIFKLSDFGCGKQWKNKELLLQTRGGTQLFWAPELFEIGLTYTNSVDVFAMGLVFLAMLNYTKDPKMAPSFPKSEEYITPIGIAVKAQSAEDAIIFLNDDPDSMPLKAIIRDMVKADPEDRITAEEVVELLQTSNNPYIKITRNYTFFVEQSIFGPNHYSPITLENKTFNSTIHYVMYKKCLVFNNYKLAQDVLESSSFKVWKTCGRSLTNYDDKKWSKMREEILKEVLTKKFSSSKCFLAEIMKTRGTELVFAVDNAWGIGKRINDKSFDDPTTWKYDNMYGKVLTKVRNDLSYKSF